MTRNFLIILGLWCFRITTFSQSFTLTGESPNYYLKVDEVYTNGVRVTETLANQLSNFLPGDKVLIMQMSGAVLDTTSVNFKTTDIRTRKSVGSTGRFEILQVSEVNTSGVDTIIYFTDDLTNSYDNFAIEKIQLIKVIEGETVTVSGTLTSKAWNGKVGGIIAILGIDTIKFESNSVIDVSGKGFRGAPAPSENYPDGLCRYGLSSAIKDTLYFRPGDLYRSGNKGEGIVTARWPYSKGTAFNMNGGGAGNGLFAGGGGGSNYLAGGDGGQQSASCEDPYSSKGGWGGYSCYEFYFVPELPKAIFGGGGGTGTRKSGSTPSNGGNGGGMIILITGTVVTGSNVTLKANGNNAWPATTTGSGAGGGAGGTILVDATEFQGPQFTVQVRGGNGSSTTTPGPNVNGAGGGGSGGVFWHSLPVSPLIILDSINGSGGITPTGSGNPLQLGLPGLQGVRLKELIVPLTGFLFNTIRGIDTICESQLPGILTASKPKGGDGNYTFVWQQSTDNLNWLPAIGEDEPRSFIPVALNQTTYYRRIVSSQSPLTMEAIHDTSRVIEVFVYPAIANNSISGTDTICYNNDAKILTGSAPAGGNSIYSYFWQMSSDLIQWNNTGNAPNYDPTQLTASTSYRRIINSTAYCSDTSNYIKIAVLPSITGNNFNITDTAICMNTSPGRILLNYPGGGDGEYAYKWESKTSSDWNSIPSTTDSVVYSEGILTEQTSYRRIVYSGFNNACIDTGNNYTVAVRPPVSNNIIGGSSIKYTCYNSPIVLNGSEPQNGFGPGTYAYAWEESENSTDWQEISQTNRDLQSDNLTSTRYFRRKVYSTPQYHECEDTSSFIEVRINPLPTGNVFSQSDTICAGSTLNVKFTLAGNGPFNVSVRGDVETARSLTGITGPSDSISFNPQITQEFVMVSVEDDSGCFADGSGFVPVVAGMVYENPIAIAGEDSESCGDTFILSATKTNSEYKGLWTASDAIFSDSTLENTNTTVSYYGPHVFKWTETNWHCTDDDEVEIIFYERPDIPDAGADQELNFKYTTSLQGSVPSIGNGIWSVISGSCDFSDLNDPNAIVSELSEETLIRWTVVNGLCPAVSDSLKIIINPLEIKKAFTPNGDGVNDYLNMGTASSVENINIRIFNRSGLPVFELDDQCIVEFSGIGECSVWDGKNQKNIDSPEGTYFYIAKIKVEGKENEVEFRSFVEIMR